jgi:hypothetical protein
MGVISVSLPSDGTTADVGDYNTPIQTIVNAINGNLDNANIAAAAAIDGSKLANASVTPTKLATGAAAAYVATSETTTSTTYADLATVTDTVTVTIGANGLALVSLVSYISNSTVNIDSYVGFAVSGASTVAAADTSALMFQAYTGGAISRIGGSFLLTGLTAGSTTFKMKYRCAANTATFKDRRISVLPL